MPRLAGRCTVILSYSCTLKLHALSAHRLRAALAGVLSLVRHAASALRKEQAAATAGAPLPCRDSRICMRRGHTNAVLPRSSPSLKPRQPASGSEPGAPTNCQAPGSKHRRHGAHSR